MKLKSRIAVRDLVIGSWITMPALALAEIMSRAGFDLVVIDLEHSSLSIAEAGELIRVIDLAGASPIVRLSSNDSTQIKRILDAGAEGIVVPMVNTLADVEQAFSSMRYPPMGSRGVGLGRAQGYGPGFSEYFQTDVSELLLFVQIEHEDALHNLDDIFGSGLVDGYIVGPYDLSCSLGVPGEFESAKFKAALEKIRSCGDKHGVVGGLHVVEPDCEAVEALIDAGYLLLIYSVDFRIIQHNCSSALKRFRSRTV